MSGIIVNFVGRLGTDAESRQTKSGTEFIALKVACDEFKNNTTSTTWMNVYDWSVKTKKMLPYLKKGSLVSIQGLETINAYLSRNGEPMFNRDVSALNIDFVNVGKKQVSEAKAESESVLAESKKIDFEQQTKEEELPF